MSTTITPANVRNLSIVAVRDTFKHTRRFGEVPESCDSAVAAWYWAFYAAHGGRAVDSHQKAREHAIEQIRYLAPETFARAPEVDESGALTRYPTIDEAPFAPGAAEELCRRDMGIDA